MAARKFTRYYRDEGFRAAVDEQFEYSSKQGEKGVWITYAIHDPTSQDSIDSSPDGPVIYVGQSKEFPKRVRKRMRDAGTAVSKPRDRIDGASYEIMQRGGVPTFRVIDRCADAISSLVSETNYARKFRRKGFTLLNRWPEQMSGNEGFGRYDVPHKWLWPLAIEDLIGSNITLVATDIETNQSIDVDLAAFDGKIRANRVRKELKRPGVKISLRVN